MPAVPARRWVLGATVTVFAVYAAAENGPIAWGYSYLILDRHVSRALAALALAMFWALPTSILGGNAAAAGIALINGTGNLAGFFSPAIIGFLKTYTGTLNSGLFLVSGCLIASAILILGLVPAKMVNR